MKYYRKPRFKEDGIDLEEQYKRLRDGGYAFIDNFISLMKDLKTNKKKGIESVEAQRKRVNEGIDSMLTYFTVDLRTDGYVHARIAEINKTTQDADSEYKWMDDIKCRLKLEDEIKDKQEGLSTKPAHMSLGEFVRSVEEKQKADPNYDPSAEYRGWSSDLDEQTKSTFNEKFRRYFTLMKSADAIRRGLDTQIRQFVVYCVNKLFPGYKEEKRRQRMHISEDAIKVLELMQRFLLSGNGIKEYAVPENPYLKIEFIRHDTTELRKIAKTHMRRKEEDLLARSGIWPLGKEFFGDTDKKDDVK